MHILFVNVSALKFTVATPYHAPLGGSESALCYLSKELSLRGHDVSLTANLPGNIVGGSLIEGVRHFSIEMIKDTTFFMSEKFDLIILCNAPAAAAPLKALTPRSTFILWTHVLPDQPSMQVLRDPQVGPQTREAIDHVVYVSNWQKSEFDAAFAAFKKSHVIGNGIAPAFENMFGSAADVLRAKQNRAAYTATPYRGLSVLVRSMDGLDRDTHLDIFSSMRVYQSDDAEYKPIFDLAGQNPAITCHGSVSQTELAHHLHAAAFFFYPSIYHETFCITAAEAMAAGMRVVATKLGALEETTMGLADLVPVLGSDGHTLVASFREAMRSASDAFVNAPEAWAAAMYAQSQIVNELYRWTVKASEWEKISN